MSNLAVISQQAIENIPPTASREDRLHITLKVLRTLRDSTDHCTHRLAVLLRGTLQNILADPAGEADEKKQIIAALDDLKRIDPRRLKRNGQNAGKASEDLLANCLRGDSSASDDDADNKSGDPWDDDPTRASDELWRLNDVERQFTHYVRGRFVMKPDADMKAFVLAVLDGRQPTVETFTKLYNYVKARGGPLYNEVERILREAGALPSVDPTAPTYGGQLLEELRSRS